MHGVSCFDQQLHWLSCPARSDLNIIFISLHHFLFSLFHYKQSKKQTTIYTNKQTNNEAIQTKTIDSKCNTVVCVGHGISHQ